MTIFTKMEHLSVEGVMLLFFHQKASLMQDVDGQALMTDFPNAIKHVPDPDGIRIEIECANCNAHLGHEFVGERLTDKNTRECVNSISIRFIPKEKELPKQFMNDKTEIATLANGCFWCTEAIFKRLKGIESVLPGYAGGICKKSII